MHQRQTNNSSGKSKPEIQRRSVRNVVTEKICEKPKVCKSFPKLTIPESSPQMLTSVKLELCKCHLPNTQRDRSRDWRVLWTTGRKTPLKVLRSPVPLRRRMSSTICSSVVPSWRLPWFCWMSLQGRGRASRTIWKNEHILPDNRKKNTFLMKAISPWIWHQHQSPCGWDSNLLQFVWSLAVSFRFTLPVEVPEFGLEISFVRSRDAHIGALQSGRGLRWTCGTASWWCPLSSSYDEWWDVGHDFFFKHTETWRFTTYDSFQKMQHQTGFFGWWASHNFSPINAWCKFTSAEWLIPHLRTFCLTLQFPLSEWGSLCSSATDLMRVLRVSLSTRP